MLSRNQFAEHVFLIESAVVVVVDDVLDGVAAYCRVHVLCICMYL